MHNCPSIQCIQLILTPEGSEVPVECFHTQFLWRKLSAPNQQSIETVYVQYTHTHTHTNTCAACSLVGKAHCSSCYPLSSLLTPQLSTQLTLCQLTVDTASSHSPHPPALIQNKTGNIIVGRQTSYTQAIWKEKEEESNNKWWEKISYTTNGGLLNLTKFGAV